eukprot:PLAT140.3.p1 GENE.PLAT140.3~~PLAT140.3.p1  ORF type:complete len:431 (-),score=107.18 PLAT140.3:740-2032(-)
MAAATAPPTFAARAAAAIASNDPPVREKLYRFSEETKARGAPFSWSGVGFPGSLFLVGTMSAGWMKKPITWLSARMLITILYLAVGSVIRGLTPSYAASIHCGDVPESQPLLSNLLNGTVAVYGAVLAVNIGAALLYMPSHELAALHCRRIYASLQMSPKAPPAVFWRKCVSSQRGWLYFLFTLEVLTTLISLISALAELTEAGCSYVTVWILYLVISLASFWSDWQIRSGLLMCTLTMTAFRELIMDVRRRLGSYPLPAAKEAMQMLRELEEVAGSVSQLWAPYISIYFSAMILTLAAAVVWLASPAQGVARVVVIASSLLVTLLIALRAAWSIGMTNTAVESLSPYVALADYDAGDHTLILQQLTALRNSMGVQVLGVQATTAHVQSMVVVVGNAMYLTLRMLLLNTATSSASVSSAVIGNATHIIQP